MGFGVGRLALVVVVASLMTSAGDVGAATSGRSMAAYGDCPADHVCLWEDRDYSGQMIVVFSCCDWRNLADVSFNNRMSSWRNRKGIDAKVADFSDGNGDRLCLNNNSSSAFVGSAWNDRATSIKIFSGAGAC